MKKLKLLDFVAPWCTYCSLMDNTMKKLAAEYADRIDIIKINIDTDVEMAKKYRVMGVPTCVIINEKEEILGRVSGFHTEESMREFIDSCLM